MNRPFGAASRQSAATPSPFYVLRSCALASQSSIPGKIAQFAQGYKIPWPLLCGAAEDNVVENFDF
jgi:hypothetical protein